GKDGPVVVGVRKAELIAVGIIGVGGGGGGRGAGTDGFGEFVAERVIGVDGYRAGAISVREQIAGRIILPIFGGERGAEAVGDHRLVDETIQAIVGGIRGVIVIVPMRDLQAQAVVLPGLHIDYV